MTKFTKTITAAPGSEGVVRLDVNERYQRLTNLPTGWKKIRLAAFLSFTNLVGDNNTPNTETVTAPGTNTKKMLLMGISNGTGFPGVDAGNKFIGMSMETAANSLGIWNASSLWFQGGTPGGSNYCHQVPAFWTGSVWTTATNSVNLGAPQSTNPSGLTLYCWAWIIELDCRTANSLTTKFVVSSGWNSASDAQMLSLLGNYALLSGSTPTITTSAWWDNTGSNPVGCQYFLIRSPFQNNRLRIHNMAYQQIN